MNDINIDSMPTNNKKKIVCFIEQKQLKEIEKTAMAEGVTRSVIIRKMLGEHKNE